LFAALALLVSLSAPPAGVRYEIVSGALMRKSGERVIRLDSIEPNALGTVLDADGDALGAIFVVSDKGLWSGWEELDVLDRVELLENAPPGAPTSVFVDAQRRVWLATDTSVGVVDPVYFFGRTLDDVAERCGAGPYRVRAGAAGKPLFRGSLSEVEHDPDAAPPPRVVSVSTAARELARGDVLSSRYPRRIELVAHGAAHGGAVLRYRLDHHHVWLPFDGALALERTPPGNHRLEIVAEDASLRRSEPFAVQLAISLPTYYEPKFVAAVAAVAAIGLIASFLRRYRALPARARAAQSALSSAIAFVLVLQVLAGIAGHAAGWPFVGYTMYSDAYGEGSCTYEMSVVGLGPSGERLYIPFQALGVATDDPTFVHHALIDGGPAVARDYVERWNALIPSMPLAGVAVHSRRVRLMASGPVRVAPLIHFSWRTDER
jgi:hypothetical protein